MIAEHYLKKVGNRIGRISHASTLGSATEAVSEQDIDLVLLDLTLPDSSIDETLDALVRLTRRFDSCFVALSSLNTDDVARKAVENGAVSFLGKQDISASAFLDLLDGLGFKADDEGSSASTLAVFPTERAAQPVRGAEDIPGAEALAPAALASTALTSTALAHTTLAAQIAHDAMSWASNLTFRTRAMSADPAIQASEELQASLASIQESAKALTSFIAGARSLLMTELELPSALAAEKEEVNLSTWLTTVAERWKKSTRDKRLELQVDATSSVRLPRSSGAQLLQQAVAALLHNARQHAARPEGPIIVSLRETITPGSNVIIEVVDDGGPWDVGALTAQGTPLGSPLGTGEYKAPSAGLGLFMASRTLQALGGSLTIFPRDDDPGSYAIRIELPRA